MNGLLRNTRSGLEVELNLANCEVGVVVLMVIMTRAFHCRGNDRIHMFCYYGDKFLLCCAGGHGVFMLPDEVVITTYTTRFYSNGDV